MFLCEFKSFSLFLTHCDYSIGYGSQLGQYGWIGWYQFHRPHVL
uniref:Uncharacterized protein n=1 Tax=Arundo donax TaxID=35708 RepID=A0A0A9HA09_ARUDO